MRITKIKETCLYVADLDRCELFYTQVLGLERIARTDGRHVFFRVGQEVLLCFIAATTRQPSEKAPHGAAGVQHVAFEVPAVEYDAWKARLQVAGVAVVEETHWRPGVRSVYFRDPDGHMLELVEPGLWER